MEFHERVKAFRDEILEMSQGELARALNINQSRLSNYENGHRDFPFDILVRISKVANMTIYEFLKYTDEMHPEYKRYSAFGQRQLAREVQSNMLASFMLKYEQFFANHSDVRDLISLLAELPEDELDVYVKNQKKYLSNRVKKQ